MRVYTVIAVDNHIPKIALTTLNREEAVAYAKDYAKDWSNEQHRASDEVYFNQREDGSMEYAVSVQESEIPPRGSIRVLGPETSPRQYSGTRHRPRVPAARREDTQGSDTCSLRSHAPRTAN